MARWLSLAAATLVLAAPAALAASPLPVVVPAALAEGALACRGLPNDFATAGRRIDELGWSRSTSNRPEGQMFGRNDLILVLTPPDGHGHPMSCMIMGSVGRRVSADLVYTALATALGRRPEDSDGAARFWQLDGGQVMAVMVAEGNVLVTAWYQR
jgi:hypothetical protein